jgi:hypothetical protein
VLEQGRAEMAALRWVTLDEADELASGTIYEPARAYLRREQGRLKECGRA